VKSRHRAREIALQVLYQFDLATHSTGQPAPQGRVLSASLIYHFDHFAVPDTLRAFVGQLVVGTLENIPAVDTTLEKHAAHWKIARMSSIDRSLLRMAIYEMLHIKDVPHSVVIDEAVELAKQFGTSESPAFINGILDSIKTEAEQPA